MKRLIRTQHLEINIVAVLNDIQEVAAAIHEINLEHRNMKLEYELTDAQYKAYVNFLRTVASIIVNSGFSIVDEYQSNESYSYYIQFTPELYEGINDADVENSIPKKRGSDIVLDVKFRLSDHYKTGEPTITDSVGRSKSAGVVFKEFVVSGVTHDSIQGVVKDIREICEDLKVGDYSRFV